MNKAPVRLLLSSLLLPHLLAVGCARQPATTERELTPSSETGEAIRAEEISTEDFEAGEIDPSQADAVTLEDDQGEVDVN